MDVRRNQTYLVEELKLYMLQNEMIKLIFDPELSKRFRLLENN
jgi:hypothetical protein